MSEKKIALLVGQTDEFYQQQFISGVRRRACEYGYDVYIYAMYIKYQNNKNREIGDSNIYNLIDYSNFDAVIILSDTIQTPGVNDRIEEQVHSSFDGPVVCIDRDSKYFHSFWTDGYSSVYSLVSHFIEEHSLTDIAYLTGRKNHIHSQRRLKAYQDAMKDHGLAVRDDRIFYGDFWYTSGTGCAEVILRNPDNMPQAVICANDCMAIGFAEEMERRGVRIPEDIALAGYGTSDEGRYSPKALTSTYVPAEYYGSYSVDYVMNLKDGREISEPDPEASLFLGETCGCGGYSDGFSGKRSTWTTNDSDDGYYSIHNYMFEDMLVADSLEELFRVIYENIYYLKDARYLSINLNKQWLDDEALLGNELPETGYSQEVINVLTYIDGDAECSGVGTGRNFRSKEMLYRYDKELPYNAYYFVPLFFEERSFGYAMISFDDGCYFGETERLWFNDISRGLESYRRLRAINLSQSRAARHASKFSGGAQLSSGSLSEAEYEEMENVRALLDDNSFTYHFQPIVNSIDGEIYSYEALMRSGTEHKIPPLQIIKWSETMGRLNDIERATFINVLNIVGDSVGLFSGKKVFINSIPGCTLSSEDNEMVEAMLRQYSDITVVELTEQAELNDEELTGLKERYRGLGIDIAVDDYGTGYSNVGNLLRYMPGIVKIDRSLLSEIQSSSQKQHFVREIVDFCHANNIKALAEGVETAQELETVIRLGADLIQGYYVARPSADIISSVDSNIKMEIARYHREKEDGLNESSYIAGQTNRVSVNSLLKDGKSLIIIGTKDMTFRDITIVGTPNIDTGIHIEVLEGYDGRVTLENVSLSNIKKRPCIDMADSANMTLRLEGENRMKGGGIRVPESSKLTIEGDGNLKIILEGSESFAIGNSVRKGHGEIDFYQDGEINVSSTGKTIIGIGSGLGGCTRINRGKYVFGMNGDEGVAVGSLRGDQPLYIHDVDLYMDTKFYKGVGIGNVYSETYVDITRSLLRADGGGNAISIIGSLDGEMAEVYLHDMNFKVNVGAANSTSLGSLRGRSVINVETAGLTYTGHGHSALVYGGDRDDTEVHINDVAVNIDIRNSSGVITKARPENYSEEYGTLELKINDTSLSYI